MSALMEQHQRWLAARERLGVGGRAVPVVAKPAPAVKVVNNLLPPERLPIARPRQPEPEPLPAPRREPSIHEINEYIMRDIRHKPLRWRQVADDTCHRHGVNMREVRGRGQARCVKVCRAEIIWRLHELGLSANDIGVVVKRDASSVYHSLRQWRRFMGHPDAMYIRFNAKAVVADVVAQVSSEYRVAAADIMSRRRRGTVSEARHEVMWRLFKSTSMSLVEIGQHLNKDHSSVIYAIRKREAAEFSTPVKTIGGTELNPVDNRVGAEPELV